MPVLVVTLALVLGVPTGAEIQQAARQVLDDPSLQTDLPGQTAYTDWVPPTRQETAPAGDVDLSRIDETGRPDEGPRTRPWERRQRGDDGEFTGLDGAPALGNALMWLLLVVAVVITGMWLARALSGYTKDVKVRPGGPQLQPPAPAKLTRPKTEAERLAEEGRFDEAVHVLLLETLRELERHVDGGIRSSYTSREILRRIDLPESARPELAGLVESVEQTLFGHQVADRSDYDACTRHFVRFAEAYDAAHRAGARA